MINPNGTRPPTVLDPDAIRQLVQVGHRQATALESLVQIKGAQFIAAVGLEEAERCLLAAHRLFGSEVMDTDGVLGRFVGWWKWVEVAD